MEPNPRIMYEACPLCESIDFKHKRGPKVNS